MLPGKTAQHSDYILTRAAIHSYSYHPAHPPQSQPSAFPTWRSPQHHSKTAFIIKLPPTSFPPSLCVGRRIKYIKCIHVSCVWWLWLLWWYWVVTGWQIVMVTSPQYWWPVGRKVKYKIRKCYNISDYQHYIGHTCQASFSSANCIHCRKIEVSQHSR